MSLDFAPKGSDFFKLGEALNTDSLERLDSMISLLEATRERKSDTELNQICALGYAGSFRMVKLLDWLGRWIDDGASPERIEPEQVTIALKNEEAKD